MWRRDRVSGARIHLHGAGRASGAPHVERGRELVFFFFVGLAVATVSSSSQWTHYIVVPGTSLARVARGPHWFVLLACDVVGRYFDAWNDHEPRTPAAAAAARLTTLQGACATRPIPAVVEGGGGGEVVEDSSCDR